MKQIVDYIDAYLNDTIDEPTIHYYGLAELVTRQKERFPATINERVKVSLDQSYTAICYHRVISSSTEVNEELSFGIKTVNQNNVVLRTVLAYKIAEYSEIFRYEFKDAMPDQIRIAGYETIFLEPGDSNEDHEAIVEEESIQTVYEKHRILWNIYSFDTTFEIIACPKVYG